MNNLHVKKGDTVKVLAGKDKGKTGKVLATDPRTATVLVEGINMATHHIKARSATEPGGRKTVEAPIAVSNLQIVCPSCGKSVRVRHKEVDGKNARICAKCGASLDVSAKTEKDKKGKKAKAKKAKDETPETAEVAEEQPQKAKTKKAKEEAPAQEGSAPAKKPAAKKKTVPVDQGSDGKTE